jgi:hypothetical protein
MNRGVAEGVAASVGLQDVDLPAEALVGGQQPERGPQTRARRQLGADLETAVLLREAVGLDAPAAVLEAPLGKAPMVRW